MKGKSSTLPSVTVPTTDYFQPFVFSFGGYLNNPKSNTSPQLHDLAVAKDSSVMNDKEISILNLLHLSSSVGYSATFTLSWFIVLISVLKFYLEL